MRWSQAVLFGTSILTLTRSRYTSIHGTPLMHEVAHLMHAEKTNAQHLAFMVDEALSSSRKRKKKEYRQPLREVLRAYL